MHYCGMLFVALPRPRLNRGDYSFSYPHFRLSIVFIRLISFHLFGTSGHCTADKLLRNVRILRIISSESKTNKMIKALSTK